MTRTINLRDPLVIQEMLTRNLETARGLVNQWESVSDFQKSSIAVQVEKAYQLAARLGCEGATEENKTFQTKAKIYELLNEAHQSESAWNKAVFQADKAHHLKPTLAAYQKAADLGSEEALTGLALFKRFVITNCFQSAQTYLGLAETKPAYKIHYLQSVLKQYETAHELGNEEAIRPLMIWYLAFGDALKEQWQNAKSDENLYDQARISYSKASFLGCPIAAKMLQDMITQQEDYKSRMGIVSSTTPAISEAVVPAGSFIVRNFCLINRHNWDEEIRLQINLYLPLYFDNFTGRFKDIKDKPPFIETIYSAYQFGDSKAPKEKFEQIGRELYIKAAVKVIHSICKTKRGSRYYQYMILPCVEKDFPRLNSPEEKANNVALINSALAIILS